MENQGKVYVVILFVLKHTWALTQIYFVLFLFIVAVKQPEPVQAPVPAPVSVPAPVQQPAVLANEQPKNFNYVPPVAVQQPQPVRQQPIVPQPEPVKVIPAVVSQPAPVVIPEVAIKQVEVQPSPVPFQMPQPQTQPKPAAEQVDGFVCDSCKAQIVGARYQCAQCDDYDLCLGCYPFRFSNHPEDHSFRLVDAGAKPAPAVQPVVEQPKPEPVPVAQVQPPVIVEAPPKPVVVEPPKPVVVEQPKAEEPFKYETELALLINMGLDDKEKVRKLLVQFNGQVNSVVDQYFAA